MFSASLVQPSQGHDRDNNPCHAPPFSSPDTQSENSSSISRQQGASIHTISSPRASSSSSSATNMRRCVVALQCLCCATFFEPSWLGSLPSKLQCRLGIEHMYVPLSLACLRWRAESTRSTRDENAGDPPILQDAGQIIMLWALREILDNPKLYRSELLQASIGKPQSRPLRLVQNTTPPFRCRWSHHWLVYSLLLLLPWCLATATACRALLSIV